MIHSETIGNCTLYLGDSKELITSLKDCADCIVSDPPYKLTSGGSKTGKMGGCFSKDKYNNSGSIVKADISWEEVMNIFYLGLRKGHCYSMCNDKNILGMLLAAQAAKFKFHNMLVWDKFSCTPNRWYMKNLEFTGLFYKSPDQYINNMGSKQYELIKQKDKTNHPTEKPVSLFQKYIDNSTQPGEVVFDPFMGSGTTGVACVLSGRRFIGIEFDKQYYEVACQRIKKEVKAQETWK